jgi:Arc-like DNA binding domain
MQDRYNAYVLQKWIYTKMTGKRGQSGRKSKGEFSQLTSSLTIRIPDNVRKQLESEAAARGRSLAQELLRRVNDTFKEDRDADRDPALRALNYLIAQLGEKISGGKYRHKTIRARMRSNWRTHPFLFRAFKVAVNKLLDTLEEPAGEVCQPSGLHLFESLLYARITSKDAERLLREFAGNTKYEAYTEKAIKTLKSNSDGPVLHVALEMLTKTVTTPEIFGAFAFSSLWTQSQRTGPLSEYENHLRQEYPDLGARILREFYTLPKARRDLELKPKANKTAEADK